MAEQTLGNYARQQTRAVLGRVGQVARLEARFASTLLREAARATARGAALFGAGAAVGAFSLGMLGVAAGLALTGKEASRATLAGVALGGLAVGLVWAGVQLLPTEAFGQARALVRAQVSALKQPALPS